MSKSIIEELREERQAGKASGEVPEWFTTAGYQLFKASYQYKGETVRGAYRRVAEYAANMLPGTMDRLKWEERFFEVMWKGWLACSTPVLANMGTDRGCPVSCSGSYVPDGIEGFYGTLQEVALLSKYGFGTSAYLGDIRGRGFAISKGGKASGVSPVIKQYVQMSRDVSQGGVRRGAIALYLELDHPDFHEVARDLHAYPDDKNMGWLITDEFIERLESGDEEANERWRYALWVKAITGKGYFVKPDTINRDNPQMYKDLGMTVKASNLCTEITLMSDEDHSFTCVLSSMNAAKFDEWEGTDAVYVSTVFLDCVAESFIKIGRNIKGLERAVRFTEKSRALGLGVLGFHTYLQAKGIAFEELRAQFTSDQIFRHLKEESLKASKFMAEEIGEPLWCKGYGVRNTHLLAIAPNTSSALLCGGVSQGIEAVVANVYNQPTSAGEIKRVNPVFLKLAKERGKYNNKLEKGIIDNLGSVQHLDWLDDQEKLVFKTAYEISQKVVIRLAAQRQKYICQAQSLNLFFDADEDEEYIAEVHQEAILNEGIKSLYYMRSQAGVQAAKDECISCEG